MSSYNEKDDLKKGGGDMEADILVTDAIPTNDGGGPPIPPGHSRFYCSKCQTVRFGFGLVTGVGIRSIILVGIE